MSRLAFCRFSHTRVTGWVVTGVLFLGVSDCGDWVRFISEFCEWGMLELENTEESGLRNEVVGRWDFAERSRDFGKDAGLEGGFGSRIEVKRTGERVWRTEDWVDFGMKGS